ncbi:MAG: aldo/keto reductase [Chloroflexi bacterium]|nr:aldo/keto reductase [Chloroflexota bacterium]
MNEPKTTRQLGAQGPVTFPIGLGCMGMSGIYGKTDESESLATIHAALDAGVNLIDTGDFYGMGHNELLIREVMRTRRDDAILSVKFGALRGPAGEWLGFDTRPAAVKNSLAHSLTRLGVDHIDIYRPSRLDPDVPIEDTIGAIADMVQAGYVRHIGLSEMGSATIRLAMAVHPIVDLQIEYALVSRSPESAIMPLLAEAGIGMTAYGVLSRGLLSGSLPKDRSDMRGHMPRFATENRPTNDLAVTTLDALAREWGHTPVQVAIAWVLSRGEMVVPIVGSRTRVQLVDALGALTVHLDASQRARLETLVSPAVVAGTRYAAEQMRTLDSERAG